MQEPVIRQSAQRLCLHLNEDVSLVCQGRGSSLSIAPDDQCNGYYPRECDTDDYRQSGEPELIAVDISGTF